MISKTKFITLFAVSYLFISCNNNSTTNEAKTDTSTSQSSNTGKDTTTTSIGNSANNLMNSMNSMVDRMKAMKMTGDFDIDFANMMIEHHQAAVDMSQQELSAGKDDKLKSMAQNIINQQKKEIGDLQDFLKSYKPSGMKHGEGELQKSMLDMETKMKGMQMPGDIDKDFAMMMKEHHAGAVAMSKKELANAMSAKLKKMAQKTITDQNREIKEFQDWLDKNK